MQFFAANALEDYSDRVEVFVGLGPVMYVNNQFSPAIQAAKKFGAESLLKYVKIHNILVFP